MALQDRFDSDFTNKILKRTLMSSSNTDTQPALNDNVLVSQDSIVKISNSLTSLQNAFNKIYAHTLNVRNLQQYEEKRATNIKKESSLESKLAFSGEGSTPAESSGSSISSTVLALDDLGVSIERLNNKLSRLNLSSSGGSALGMAADAASFTKFGRRALGPVGIGLDIYSRVSGGQGVGQIAAGVGGGIAGAAVGAKAGAAAGGAIGALFGGVGAVPGAAIGGFIGGVGGYFGGGYLGDTAYQSLQGRASGGAVKTGGTYVVGERGPEVLFFNGASGKVAPYGRRGPQAQAEKAFERAADQSARARAKMEKGRPIGPTSYSSKFSNYLSSLFANMPGWMQRAKEALKSLFGDDGGGADGGGGYFGGEFTELTAEEVRGSARGQNRSGSSDWRTDTAFLAEVNNVAREHNINPRTILGLIASESGFDPRITATNGAYGLFQFMPGIHTGRRGTTPISRIMQMSRAEQVRYANEQYFRPYDIPAGASAGALYASIFAPSVAKRVRYDRNAPLYSRGSDGYEGNFQLDTNDDGIITIADLDARIVGKVSEFRLPGLIAASGFVARAGGVGTVTSRYGMRGGEMHHGTDIGAPAGTKVASLNDGVIETAANLSGFGNVVYINQDDGLQVRYAHLRDFAPGIRSGVRVSATQIIGYVGNTGTSRGATGNHLHLEIRRGDASIDSYQTYMNNRWIVGGTSAEQPPAMRLPEGFRRSTQDLTPRDGVDNPIPVIITPSGVAFPESSRSHRDVSNFRSQTPDTQMQMQRYWLLF